MIDRSFTILLVHIGRKVVVHIGRKVVAHIGCKVLVHYRMQTDKCSACGKTVCYAEGTDNYPELCDDCWSQRQAAKEEVDVPF